MCSIFQLTPGYTLPYLKLCNAVWNNPHGYGIILKDANGRLKEIKKFVSEGTDPDEVYKILKDNEDLERFVHLRWATQGDISEDNTQPFCVFSSRKRTIYFMHNGTLASKWHPPTEYELRQGKPDPLPGASDSRRFAEFFLTPKLQKFVGDKGKADITDPDVQDILGEFWSGGSRGLLIASDLDPVFLNLPGWKLIKYKNSEGVESAFMASNDDYFDILKRGPVYEARKKAEEEKKERERKESSILGEVVPIDSPDRLGQFPSFSNRFSLSEDLVDILEDHDLYHASGYVQLSNMTLKEFEDFFEKHPKVAAELSFHMSHFLRQEHDIRMEKEEHISRLENRVVELEKEETERLVNVG